MDENQNEVEIAEGAPLEPVGTDSSTSDSDALILPRRRKKRRKVVYLNFTKV